MIQGCPSSPTFTSTRGSRAPPAATSSFAALHRAALEKGIAVVGTGDFTHPAWLAEISRSSWSRPSRASSGCGRARTRRPRTGLPAAVPGEVRFVLQVEIPTSTRRTTGPARSTTWSTCPTSTRPTVRRAPRRDRQPRLGRPADPRPRRPRPARDHARERPPAFLVPAHIWTPWFSVLGSKSGFDSIEECFGDLADHIFAVETGLSSDPPMNWRVSGLDRLTLVSNSDAHSPRQRSAARPTCSTSSSTTRRCAEPSRPATASAAPSSSSPRRASTTSTATASAACGSSPSETRRLGGRCPECGGRSRSA